MALPDLDQVVQQHLQLTKEQREIEDEFNLQEQHELDALEEAKRAIDAQCREEREVMISQLPAMMALPESFEKVLVDKRNALIALKEETYQREKAERQRRFDSEKRKLSHKWTTLLPANIGGLSLNGGAKSVPEAPKTSIQVPSRSGTPSRVAEKSPQVGSEATSYPTPRNATPVHAPVASQAPAPAASVPSTSFRPHNLPSIQSQHAPPYQPPGGPYPMPPASRQFSSPYPHQPNHHPLPKPPTVPSQQLPQPPQPRKPLPTGSQQPPTRYQQHPAGSSHPPPGPGHFPGDRHVAQYPPQPVVIEGPPPQSGPSLSRILNGAEPVGREFGGPAPVPPHGVVAHESSRHQQVGPSETRQPAHVAPTIVEPLGQPQDAQPLKRRFDDVKHDSQPKRARTEGADVPQSAERGPSPSRPNGPIHRTITFDEVYGNGEAKFKHQIVEYPPHSAKFYILRCDEHGVHFNGNPLAGAAKHLHSAQHGNMSKERAQAVELLGYHVVDCTMELAKKNNELFNQLLASKTYQPLNMNQASKTMRRSMGFKDTPDTAPPKVTTEPPPPSLPTLLPRNLNARGTTFRGIMEPETGGLYLAYWKNDKKNYVVIILPWTNLQSAGMNGSLSETGLLNKPVPKCYRVDPHTNQIVGWNTDVEKTKREFPVMYFDGRKSVGWARAKDLSKFEFEDPNWREIPYFREARDHYAMARGFTSYQHMVDSRSGAPPSQPPRHIGVTTISKAQVLPIEDHDHEMADAGTAPVADYSDADSVSKTSTDSDTDVEMANTESRRTSVSNRGEAQDQGEKTTVASAQAQAPAHRPSPLPLETDSIMSLAQTAQLAMAKTSPGLGPPPSTDPRMMSRPKGPDQGSRRVEKIYAHSNPNRSSKSPRVLTTTLPDRRGDAHAPQSGAPAQQQAQTPRVPSPASLENILHSQSNDQPPRPAPSQTTRALEAPAPIPIAKARIPSPLQMPRLASQTGQPAAAASVPGPASQPDSRGSTPVIVRIDSVTAQDRWRAVRTEPASASTSTSEVPRYSPQIPGPLPTPNPSSAGGTQPGSPSFQNISVKPMPSIYVKRESSVTGGSVTKEIFDVGVLSNPNDPPSSFKETVRVEIDSEAHPQHARTQPGSAITLIVDPTAIKSIGIDNGTSIRTMYLDYSDGREQQTLVFPASDVGRGMQNGSIHARRFYRWLNTVVPADCTTVQLKVQE